MKNELKQLSTEELQSKIKELESELEFRRDQLSQEFRQYAQKVIQVLQNPPKYIANSSHTDRLDATIEELHFFMDNWDSEETWQSSQLCW